MPLPIVLTALVLQPRTVAEEIGLKAWANVKLISLVSLFKLNEVLKENKHSQ